MVHRLILATGLLAACAHAGPPADAPTRCTLAPSVEELAGVRARLDTDEHARGHVWARFGLLHALGFPSVGHLAGLARTLPPEFLAQYIFHQHQALDATGGPLAGGEGLMREAAEPPSGGARRGSARG